MPPESRPSSPHPNSSTGAVAARWFSQHSSTTGIEVRIHFSGDRLLIDADGARQSVSAANFTVANGGYDGRTLVLSWDDEAGLNLLHIADAGAQRALRSAAPPALAPQLARWQRRSAVPWRGLLITAAVAVLLIVGVISASGRLLDAVIAQVPISAEIEFGETLYAQLRRGQTFAESGPAFDAVQTIGERLTKGSQYHYRWAIAEDPSINAFALPGGIIVVHRGLITAAQTPETLAGVLAHEVQHVERRHSLRALGHEFGWRLALGLILGETSGTGVALLSQLDGLGYSRDLEREADHYGILALARSGIDPAGLPRFFETLAASAPETVALLSTHPSSAARLADARRDIAALPAQSYTPLSLPWPPG